jgi:signal transduction histidine kinase
MAQRTVTSLLQGAELWQRRLGQLPDDPDARETAPALVAGWEDGDSFCAAVCTNDVGLAFCRRCPETVVQRVLATGRAAGGRCAAGTRLLAFPAPRGSRTQVAVLRVSSPTVRDAVALAPDVRVAAATLRRAARESPVLDAGATLAAARLLRDPADLQQWFVGHRHSAADRRRTTTAALAQMIVTGEEYFRLYQASQRQLAELRRSRRQVDDLARAAFREQEHERARIAHEIHDTAAQSMVGAFRHLETAQLLAEADAAQGHGPRDVRLAEAIGTASRRLSTAIHEVRAVLARVLPPGLEELGLAAAIETRARALAEESGLAMEMRGTLPRLDPWVEQALYGMTSEAVTNAVRHARASRIIVSLAVVRGRAVVEVRDDGSGFDPRVLDRRPGDGHGLGLIGIARQAEWLGGHGTVHSRPGAGTRVRISIPMERHRPRGSNADVATSVTPGREAGS